MRDEEVIRTAFHDKVANGAWEHTNGKLSYIWGQRKNSAQQPKRRILMEKSEKKKSDSKQKKSSCFIWERVDARKKRVVGACLALVGKQWLRHQRATIILVSHHATPKIPYCVSYYYHVCCNQVKKKQGAVRKLM